jgi:hypothetical protein
MRFVPSTVANAVAWAVLIGLLTLFVCTSFGLREESPT